MLNSIKRHKFAFGLIVVALAIGAYYGLGSKSGGTAQPVYTTSKAEIGTLIKTVSGSGQVSTSNQVDVKAKVAGTVLKVRAKAGDSVKKGDALVELDASDARKAVRDAEINLESAQISLAKLAQKTDAYTLLQARNSITDAESALAKLKTSQPIDLERSKLAVANARISLDQSHDDVYNAISATFLDLPDIMTSLDDTLNSYDLSTSAGQGNQTTNDYYLINGISNSDLEKRITLTDMVEQSQATYKDTKAAYDKNFADYKSTGRTADDKTLAALLEQSLVTTKSVSANLKQDSNLFDYWVNYHSDLNHAIPAKVTQYQTDLGTLITQTNQLLANLQNAQNSHKSNQDTLSKAEQDLDSLKKSQPLDLAAAEANLKIKKAYLADLNRGADALDLQAQQLSVRKSANSLQDARDNLADAVIRAPFDGVVASMDAKVSNDLASGSTVATLITNQRQAEITLNEVDVAQVKNDQKATLTFDAIDGLSLTGTVSEVDSIGAVSQGVVSYGVMIAFDTQDDRIKSGMSVSANIITATKTDALLVPGEAVNNLEGTIGTVQILVDGAPQDQTVEIGLSDDTSTEIVSGLKEGDAVITGTSTSSTKRTIQPSTRSIFQSLGGGGGPR